MDLYVLITRIRQTFNCWPCKCLWLSSKVRNRRKNRELRASSRGQYRGVAGQQHQQRRQGEEHHKKPSSHKHNPLKSKNILTNSFGMRWFFAARQRPEPGANALLCRYGSQAYAGSAHGRIGTKTLRPVAKSKWGVSTLRHNSPLWVGSLLGEGNKHRLLKLF